VRVSADVWAPDGQQAPVKRGKIRSLDVTLDFEKYLLSWIYLRIRESGRCLIGNR